MLGADYFASRMHFFGDELYSNPELGDVSLGMATLTSDGGRGRVIGGGGGGVVGRCGGSKFCGGRRHTGKAKSKPCPLRFDRRAKIERSDAIIAAPREAFTSYVTAGRGHPHQGRCKQSFSFQPRVLATQRGLLESGYGLLVCDLERSPLINSYTNDTHVIPMHGTPVQPCTLPSTKTGSF